MSTEENKELVRHAFERVNKEKNIIAFFDICDSDYVEHYTDHDETLEQAQQLILSIPAVSEYSLTIDDLLGDGDKVVYRVTHRMTFQATGKKTQMTNTCIVRIANDKIVENWVSVDTLHVGQQLGVLLPTEEIWMQIMNSVN
ncbi:MAG TPA: ester cyclase [Dehalococcoidia bacterium]|nr:ester cyclase [Dehalococcoidia bacterium]